MARTTNSGTIDFTKGLDKADIVSAPDNRSVFSRKLTELMTAVRHETAELGKFYLLAEYTNSTGANVAARAIRDRMPDGATFELEPQVYVNDDGERVSRLYAAVTALDKSEGGNGDADWQTEPDGDAKGAADSPAKAGKPAASARK